MVFVPFILPLFLIFLVPTSTVYIVSRNHLYNFFDFQELAWCADGFLSFLMNISTLSQNGVSSTSSNLVSEIAKARQHIKSSLERVDGASALSGPGVELFDRIASLEKDNSQLHGVVDGLQKLVISLEGRLNKLEGGSAKTQAKPTPAPSKPGEIRKHIKNWQFHEIL